MVQASYEIDTDIDYFDDPIMRLAGIFGESLCPPPRLNLHEWSDKYRVLPKKASSEPGQYQTSRFPFLKEVMYELSPQSPAREVWVLKGTQLGFTDVSINRIFYNMHLRPCPHLYIQNTITDVEKFSKQRLEESIAEMPIIRDKLGMAGKQSSDTIKLKSYPGGFLSLGGANSASSMRSMPICDVDLDEYESYPFDVENEGDPYLIIKRRTSNFPNRKIYVYSTPVMSKTSKMMGLYLDGDQRLYHLHCLNCHHEAPIIFNHAHYVEGDMPFWDPVTIEDCFYISYTNEGKKVLDAAVTCPKCGTHFKEFEKRKMMAEETGAHWHKYKPDNETPSFFISSLYSPIYTVKEAVGEYLSALIENDASKMKAFINTILGEPHNDGADSVHASGIMARKERYDADVPEGVLVITIGVDIQKNRIEAEAIGWGMHEESWSIAYEVFIGNIELDSPWKQLDAFIRSGFKRKDGRVIYPSITFIDAKYRKNKVEAFCKTRSHMNVYSIHGRTGWGKGLYKRPTRVTQNGVWNFTVFPDELKTKFYAQLKMQSPGQGYCHFPDRPEYNEDYFTMLTAEELKQTMTIKGVKLSWEKKKAGMRNEVLDLRVYALAGLHVLNPNMEAIARGESVTLKVKVGSTKSRARRNREDNHSAGI